MAVLHTQKSDLRWERYKAKRERYYPKIFLEESQELSSATLYCQATVVMVASL